MAMGSICICLVFIGPTNVLNSNQKHIRVHLLVPLELPSTITVTLIAIIIIIGQTVKIMHLAPRTWLLTTDYWL